MSPAVIAAAAMAAAAAGAPAPDLGPNASVLQEWLGFAFEGGLPLRPEQIAAAAAAQRHGLTPGPEAMAGRKALVERILGAGGARDAALRTSVLADLAVRTFCPREIDRGKADRRYRSLAALLPAALLPPEDQALDWLDPLTALEEPACGARLEALRHGNEPEEPHPSPAIPLGLAREERECLVHRGGECVVTVGEFNLEAEGRGEMPGAGEAALARGRILEGILRFKFANPGGAVPSKAAARNPEAASSPGRAERARGRWGALDFADLRRRHGLEDAALGRVRYLASSDSSWLARLADKSACRDSSAAHPGCAGEWPTATWEDLRLSPGEALPGPGETLGPARSAQGFLLLRSAGRSRGLRGELRPADFRLLAQSLEALAAEDPETAGRLLQRDAARAGARAPDTLAYRLWLLPRIPGGTPALDTAALRAWPGKAAAPGTDIEAWAWSRRGADDALLGPFDAQAGWAWIRIQGIIPGKAGAPSPRGAAPPDGRERLRSALERVAAAGLLGLYPASEDEPAPEAAAVRAGVAPEEPGPAGAGPPPLWGKEKKAFEDWKARLTLSEEAAGMGPSPGSRQVRQDM